MTREEFVQQCCQDQPHAAELLSRLVDMTQFLYLQVFPAYDGQIDHQERVLGWIQAVAQQAARLETDLLLAHRFGLEWLIPNMTPNPSARTMSVTNKSLAAPSSRSLSGAAKPKGGDPIT